MKHNIVTDDVLNGLCVPGRQLIFADDGGTRGKQLPNLLADYNLWSGVLIKSEHYSKVKQSFNNALRHIGIGVKEFHGTEIVNPKKGSKWRNVSYEHRLGSIIFLTEVIDRYVENIYTCFVSGEQYYKEMQPKLIQNGMRRMHHEEALRHVFTSALFEHITWSEETAIIFDSKKATIDHQVVPFHLYKSGIIRLSSDQEVGLQVADFVSFSLNRHHHINERKEKGNSNNFDLAIERAVYQLSGKIIELLPPKP